MEDEGRLRVESEWARLAISDGERMDDAVDETDESESAVEERSSSGGTVAEMGAATSRGAGAGAGTTAAEAEAAEAAAAAALADSLDDSLESSLDLAAAARPARPCELAWRRATPPSTVPSAAARALRFSWLAVMKGW